MLKSIFEFKPDFNKLKKEVEKPPFVGQKNILEFVHKLIQKKDKEFNTERTKEEFENEIKDEYKSKTDFKTLEEEIFENYLPSDDYPTPSAFPIRIIIAPLPPPKIENNLPNNKAKLPIFYKIQRYAAQFLQEYGATHIAIQVGTKVLHWFDVSFVLVLPWHSQNCSAVFCPYKGGEEIGGIENTAASREVIVKFVQEWNSKMVYNKGSFSCQTFVKKMVEKMGLNQDFFAHDTFIERWMRYVTKSDSLPIPCLIEGDKIERYFHTHEELDEWHNQNRDHYKERDILFKAFHRAFQMKGEVGLLCNYDTPTQLLNENGEKIAFDFNFLNESANDQKPSGKIISIENNK